MINNYEFEIYYGDIEEPLYLYDNVRSNSPQKFMK